MNRLSSALAVAAIALAAMAVTAPPVAAKEEVVARMLTPMPRDARPGTRIRVTWTLSFRDESGRRRPFGAGGVFIRLFGPDGSRAPRAFATELGTGRYRASVRVPRGGVRRIVIGLMGIRCNQNGCLPSPRLFPIVGKSFR